MAVGVAFVDILGDTSRTAPQVERDMNRVIAVVNDAIDPAEIRAAVEAGTEQELTAEMNRDLRAVTAAIQRVQVSAELSPETRAQLERQLRETTRRIRAARAELELRVDDRGVIAQVEEVALAAEAAAPTIDIETNVDTDRVTRSFKSIGQAALAAAPAIRTVGTAVLGLGAGIQTVSTLASVVAAIAPAAALAAPAIVTVGTAVGAVKLATAGVGDAVKAAFDPSDPQKYAEALKGLAPNARAFVEQLHTMQPALKAIQQGVQQRVFAGLAGELKTLSGSLLPQLRNSLFDAGGSLNRMALGVADTANALADSGVFGKALTSADHSLASLVSLPAIAVNAFGQLAVAAAPSLEKIAAAAGHLGDVLNSKVNAAAESGGLQKAIETAISLIGQLGHVLGNVGQILGSVFSVSNAAGGNFINTLVRVSDTLVQAFNSPEVQSGLQALFTTISTLSATVAPLVILALKAVGGALTALAPGVQTVISALGAGLQPILVALGPVLQSAGQAVTQLLMAISPLFPVIGGLIAQIGPILTPIIDALALVFQKLAPLVATVANIVGSLLQPVLAALPSVLQPFLDLVTQLVTLALPVLNDLLVALQPSFGQLATAVVQVFTALAPVLVQLTDLIITCLKPLLPLLPPIIGFVGMLASVLAGELAKQVQQIVVPALRGLSQLLSGDLSGAMNSFGTVVEGVVKMVVREFILLPGQIALALGGLAADLFTIGTKIIGSLISGILSKLGSLGGALGTVTQFIKDHKGPIEKDRQLLVPAGQAIMQGLIAGIESQQVALGRTLGGVTAQITGSGGLLRGPSITGPAVTSGAEVGSFLRRRPGATLSAPITANVFIGGQKIAEMVAAEVGVGSQAAARRMTTGARR